MKSSEPPLTVAGCILTALSVAVIGVAAVSIVTSRNSFVREMPNEVLIVVPILIGAVFCGIGTVLLKLIGLPVFVESEDDVDEEG
jgi:hypothetical protein